LSDVLAGHRAFLNRYYGSSRFIYDVTRKYYLFGRDRVLQRLAVDPSWSSLVEVGPGTGRNLERLHRLRPEVHLGGVEASDAMLAHARARCPWARLVQGFAENAAFVDVLGQPPDRILFSYCLSMVTDRVAALSNARRAVSASGQVEVVDFADFDGLPAGFARRFRGFLRTFHVEPLMDPDFLDAADVHKGPGHYFVVARFAGVTALSAGGAGASTKCS
jgi:S-adenosylmethionine-diacylgycerolhomoserine-N-methlytransferase